MKYNYLTISQEGKKLCMIRTIKGSSEEMATIDILHDKGLSVSKGTKAQYEELMSLGAEEMWFEADEILLIDFDQEID
jgi:hypothetical protein